MRTNEELINDKEFRDNLESLGFGICENELCADILPIGRGENYVWDEENHLWLCTKCSNGCKKCGSEDIRAWNNIDYVCLACGHNSVPDSVPTDKDYIKKWGNK